MREKPLTRERERITRTSKGVSAGDADAGSISPEMWLLLQRSYILRLRTFLTLRYFEGHALTFFQRFTAAAVDSTEVNEHICTTFTLNKTVTFVVVKPFNNTRD